MSIRLPVENRYNPADWEIDPDSWLWRPSTKLALLGDGFGTTKARSSGPVPVTGKLPAASMWRRIRGANGIKGDGSTQIGYVPVTVSAYPWSLALWVEMSSESSETVASLGDLAGSHNSGVFQSSGTSIGLIRYQGSPKYVFKTVANGIHHVACVCISPTLTYLFVDGILAGTLTEDCGASTTWNRLGLLSSGDASPLGYYGGTIWGIVLTSTALTLPQIRQLASRRPDMGGLIRSKYEIDYTGATAETPPAATYRPMMMQVC